MHKLLTIAAASALMVGCFSSRSSINKTPEPYVPPPQPRVHETAPARTEMPVHVATNVPASNREEGPDLEVMPYDPNAELMPDLVDADIEVLPFDPNAYQPGPFTALNNPEPKVVDAEIEVMPPTSETDEVEASAATGTEVTSPVILVPGEGTETSQPMSPKEVRLSASLDQMIVELEQRRDEEEGNTVANAKALLALYLAHGVGTNIDYADRASKLVHHLRERNDFSDQAWLKLQSAELDRQIGESGECARQLQDAYLNALKLVPVDVGALYFTDGLREPDGFMYRTRMIQDADGTMRENTVVGVGKTFDVAFKFRYLNASNVDDNGNYHYHLKIVPSLSDEDGNPVENFRGDVFSTQFTWEAPDRFVPGHHTYTLPFDIKPGDYTLSLVFYDMNRAEPEKYPVTRNIVVRVR